MPTMHSFFSLHCFSRYKMQPHCFPGFNQMRTSNRFVMLSGVRICFFMSIHARITFHCSHGPLSAFCHALRQIQICLFHDSTAHFRSFYRISEARAHFTYKRHVSSCRTQGQIRIYIHFPLLKRRYVNRKRIDWSIASPSHAPNSPRLSG